MRYISLHTHARIPSLYWQLLGGETTLQPTDTPVLSNGTARALLRPPTGVTLTRHHYEGLRATAAVLGGLLLSEKSEAAEQAINVFGRSMRGVHYSNVYA